MSVDVFFRISTTVLTCPPVTSGMKLIDMTLFFSSPNSKTASLPFTRDAKE